MEGYQKLPNSDLEDKKIAQQLFEKNQNFGKCRKSKIVLITSLLLFLVTVFGVFFICRRVFRPHHMYRAHREGFINRHAMKGLQDVFSRTSPRHFGSQVFDEEVMYPQVADRKKSCDIFIETSTGLKETNVSKLNYFQDKVDFDLCRYKEEQGLDVDSLWSSFNKFLEFAQIDLKVDPITKGSCNIPVKQIYATIRKYYPVKGYLWTGYIKPEGTHTKLKAGIAQNQNISTSYNITKTATINLALTFPFSKKLFILQQSLSTAIPTDESSNQLVKGKELKIKKALIIKSFAIPQKDKAMSFDRFYVPSEVNPKKSHHKPCSRKEKPFSHAYDKNWHMSTEKKHDESDDSIGEKIMKLIAKDNSTKKNGPLFGANDKTSKLNITAIKDTGKTLDDNTAKVNTILLQKATQVLPQNHQKPEHYIHEHDKDQTKEHKDIKQGLKDEDPHPKIVAFSEYKGFVFAEDIGFGFTEGSGALVGCKSGFFSSLTGFAKFGFCYDV